MSLQVKADALFERSSGAILQYNAWLPLLVDSNGIFYQGLCQSLKNQVLRNSFGDMPVLFLKYFPKNDCEGK